MEFIRQEPATWEMLSPIDHSLKPKLASTRKLRAFLHPTAGRSSPFFTFQRERQILDLGRILSLFDPSTVSSDCRNNHQKPSLKAVRCCEDGGHQFEGMFPLTDQLARTGLISACRTCMSSWVCRPSQCNCFVAKTSFIQAMTQTRIPIESQSHLQRRLTSHFPALLSAMPLILLLQELLEVKVADVEADEVDVEAAKMVSRL